MKWYEKQKEMYTKNEQESRGQESTVQNDVMETSAPEEGVKPAMVQTEFQNTESYSNYFNAEPAETATRISKNTILHGKIETEDALEIHGTVEGDVVCDSKLEVTGKIKGNIQCDTAEMAEAEIYGDISCRSDIKLSPETVIEGNIQTEELLCGGQIKGDIHASGGVTLASESCVIGNIIARDIEINRGAVIQGTIQIEPTNQ